MLSTLPDVSLAVLADADAIVTLVNSAYRGESARTGWTNEGALLEGSRTNVVHVRGLIASAADVVLVKKVDGVLMGCVHLEKKNAQTACLGMLTTNPQAQGGGIGSSLMQAGETYAQKTWGVREIEMTVIDVRHELIAYYVRRGYRVTGEKRPFPEDPVNGRSLIGPITFDVLVKAI